MHSLRKKFVIRPSKRGIAILLPLFMCVCGIHCHTFAQSDELMAEDRAIAAFVRKGGHLTANDRGQIVSIYFANTSFSSAELKHFAAFKELKSLNLTTCDVDDGIWPHLQENARLEKLTLWGSKITDKGLVALDFFPQLRELDVRATSIGDEGLRHIGKLKNLAALELLGTKVTSDGLGAIAAIGSLTQLGLVHTQIDDKGLAHLPKLSSLRELELEGTKITDEGLVHLGKLTKLELLTVHNAEVTEAGLRHLESLRHLKTFYFGARVGELGLKSLRKLPSLESLYVGDMNSREMELLSTQLDGVGIY